MTFETYLLYLATVAVFFATPPDTSQLLIISNSIQHGVKRSINTIAGDLTANCVQMSAASFGLTAVIAASAGAFEVIKWMGVFYLLWMGIKLILTGEKQTQVSATDSTNSFRLFRQGFLTSMANPFAIMFFAALFPQFIDTTQAIIPQLIVLGATYLAVDGALLLLWGWLGVSAATLLRRFSLQLVNRICGGLMIAAAALLGIKDIDPQQ